MTREKRARLLGFAPADLWDRIAGSAPEATFYHTRTWADILTRTDPRRRSVAQAFELEDGAVAVLPVLEYRGAGGLVRTYDSSSPGIYGGPIAERSLRQDEVESILDSVAFHGALTKVRLNGNPFASWRLRRGASHDGAFTQVLDLSCGFDAWLGNSSSSNRSNVRKAERSGITVRLASSVADYQAYYSVYEDTLRRWGERTLYREPLDLLLNSRECADDAVRLWLAEMDGAIVGGLFAVYHNEYVTGFHAASLQSHLKYKLNNLLHYEAIRDACDRGFRIYDMGPSGGQQGVIDFKSSLGAQHLEYQSIVLSEGPVYRAARAVKATKSFISSRLPSGLRAPIPSA